MTLAHRRYPQDYVPKYRHMDYRNNNNHMGYRPKLMYVDYNPSTTFIEGILISLDSICIVRSFVSVPDPIMLHLHRLYIEVAKWHNTQEAWLNIHMLNINGCIYRGYPNSHLHPPIQFWKNCMPYYMQDYLNPINDYYCDNHSKACNNNNHVVTHTVAVKEPHHDSVPHCNDDCDCDLNFDCYSVCDLNTPNLSTEFDTSPVNPFKPNIWRIY